MKVSQRELTLGIATLAVVLLGTTWYMVDKQLEPWKAKAMEIDKLEQQIRHHESAIKMQENWLGELNELQSQLPVFDTSQRSVAPELMKTIKSLASRYGVVILNTNPRSEKPTGDLFELGINCSWEGSLEALVGFLTEVQQLGVRYDIRSLNVMPVGKNTGKLKGSMEVHCAFTRKPAAPENKR